jgi:hypothetical protein
MATFSSYFDLNALLTVKFQEKFRSSLRHQIFFRILFEILRLINDILKHELNIILITIFIFVVIVTTTRALELEHFYAWRTPTVLAYFYLAFTALKTLYFF